MGLRILTSHGSGCLAAVDGEMTIYTAAALKGDIEAVGLGEIEIDLSGVTDIDTAGLQWMLMAKRLDGAAVRFVNHSPPLLRILELANLAGAVGDPLLLSSGDPRQP